MSTPARRRTAIRLDATTHAGEVVSGCNRSKPHAASGLPLAHEMQVRRHCLRFPSRRLATAANLRSFRIQDALGGMTPSPLRSDSNLSDRARGTALLACELMRKVSELTQFRGTTTAKYPLLALERVLQTDGWLIERE